MRRCVGGLLASTLDDNSIDGFREGNFRSFMSDKGFCEKLSVSIFFFVTARF
jgi:hypothetical protein